MNIGEEICGEWLRHKGKCDFVQYNLKTTDPQGEIDVIGINLAEKKVCACEVAVHLTTGLRYVKHGRPDTVMKIMAKFRNDIKYVRTEFPKPEYDHIFMLWSPIVKNPKPGAKENQLEHVMTIVRKIEEEFGETIKPVINEKFQEVLDELRDVALKETKELNSSFMRVLQIQGHLKKHLSRLRPTEESPV